MIEIKTLEGLPFDTLYTAFRQAFADYDAPTISREALAVMLERRGFLPEYSLGAFDGDKLVSFTFNGIGIHLNKKTAYDTGTGTIKEYRGQKLAGHIFEKSIPLLKKKGIEQYLLEVLQHNTPAFNIYQSQDFEISREFNYYIIEAKKLNHKDINLSEEYDMREIDLSYSKYFSAFWDFQPAWQNSLDSIMRRAKDFYLVGAFHNDFLAGYGILDPNSGDVTQLAVHKDHRQKGIASAIFNQLINRNKYTSLKILNTEKGYQPMESFIRSIGIELTGLQYEMKRSI